MEILKALNEGFPLISVEAEGSKAYPKLYFLADKTMCDDYMLCVFFLLLLLSIIKNSDFVKMYLNSWLNSLMSSCEKYLFEITHMKYIQL